MNGHEKLTIPGAPFQQMLFSVWLGPNPPNAALKKGPTGRVTFGTKQGNNVTLVTKEFGLVGSIIAFEM